MSDEQNTEAQVDENAGIPTDASSEAAPANTVEQTGDQNVAPAAEESAATSESTETSEPAATETEAEAQSEDKASDEAAA